MLLAYTQPLQPHRTITVEPVWIDSGRPNIHKMWISPLMDIFLGAGSPPPESTANFFHSPSCIVHNKFGHFPFTIMKCHWPSKTGGWEKCPCRSVPVKRHMALGLNINVLTMVRKFWLTDCRLGLTHWFLGPRSQGKKQRTTGKKRYCWSCCHLPAKD